MTNSIAARTHFTNIIEDKQECDRRFQTILQNLTDEELRFYKEAIYQEENRRFKERIQNKEPGLQLTDEEKKMIDNGDTILAIRTYRERNRPNVGLVQAKDVVEDWKRAQEKEKSRPRPNPNSGIERGL